MQRKQYGFIGIIALLIYWFNSTGQKALEPQPQAPIIRPAPVPPIPIPPPIPQPDPCPD